MSNYPSCGTHNLDDHTYCFKCGYSLTGATGQLLPDTVLEGRYIIVETLGRGGMGAVYKALDQRLNNIPVAIKEMSTRAVGQGNLQAAVGAFKKEASMLIILRHPALPRISDFFSKGEDRWYLVMDYIKGETLKAIAEKRGPISELEVLDWARQLCAILDYLHCQKPPVIFRDLKPANIMLTPGGEIKLIDFGIARHFQPDSLTDTTAYGSPGYAPPEQHGKTTDARSDIYALGATLHHLLTGVDPGKQPFIFDSPEQFVRVSPEFSSAIMRALELKPENRPASAKDMLALFRVAGVSQHDRTETLLLGETLQEPSGTVSILAVNDVEEKEISAQRPGESKSGVEKTEILPKNEPGRKSIGSKQPPEVDATEKIAMPASVPDESEDVVERAETLTLKEAGWKPNMPPELQKVPATDHTIKSRTGGLPGKVKYVAVLVSLLLLLTAGWYRLASVFDVKGEVVPELNQVKWKFKTEGSVFSSPAISRGVVYFGSYEKFLYAVDSETGEELWKFKTEDCIDSSPAISNGIVYFGSDDGYLYAVDSEIGEELWKFKTEGPVNSSPVISNGIVYFGSDDGYLYAVDSETGEELWKFKTEGPVDSSPAISNGIVYFRCFDGYLSLYAVDSGTGEELWKLQGYVASSPTISGGVVYYGRGDGYLNAVDSETGEELWKFKTEGPVFSSPAISNGIVYFGSHNGYLYAVDSETEKELWKFKTEADINTSAAISNGIVCFKGGDGYLYAVDSETGEELWNFKTDGYICSSPAISGGVVYFGSHDGYFYALE